MRTTKTRTTRKIKGCARSMTIWFNGALLAALPLVEYALIELPAILPEVQPYLPDNIYKFMGMVVVVGNIMLRFKTTSCLSSK